MVLDLSEITFTADFFSTSTPNGSLMIMNLINEDVLTADPVDSQDEDEYEAKISEINIVISPVDGDSNINCSSVIGMSNDYYGINTDYTELIGKTLNSDNMQYCTIELYESE